MTLSVVIVNYNVKYFLEQCLFSLQKALEGIEGEVIVVDNHSTDGSVEYLQPKFPWVAFLSNKHNVGFSRACNQGLGVSTGDYVLFLNPDTLLGEDSLHTCVKFMDRHPQAGAAGVRMVDGAGRFLKESKRSFPSPLTSLFKLFGVSSLFPRSGVFSRYHLGHLDEHQTHEVDVLAGAFMLVRREVLKQVGAFDETFFMYGEDVDLSYRIQKAGYRNYYIADTDIIHFKGESTKRGSLNYVRMFYSAMSLFVQKHYGGAQASLFRSCIQVAIWLRAVLSVAAKFLRWSGLPLVDAVLILLSFGLMKEVWVQWVRPDIVYPEQLLSLALPAFTLLYLLAAYYTGLYNKYYRGIDLVRSTGIATMVVLSLYALLPEQYRFSRGILLFGALTAFVLLSAVRLMLLRTGVLQLPREGVDKPFILIAGEPGEAEEAKALLGKSRLQSKVIGRIAVGGDTTGALATLEGLHTVARGLNARELIFCAGALPYRTIIRQIQKKPAAPGYGQLRMRFHAVGSESVVGSDSSGTSGAVIAADRVFRLARPQPRRLKRLVDVVAALAFLLTLPVHLLLVKRPLRFLGNCLAVLGGGKTWVGYAMKHRQLPRVRPGVLAPNGLAVAASQALPKESLKMVDYWYARDYEVAQDIRVMWRGYRELGS